MARAEAAPTIETIRAGMERAAAAFEKAYRGIKLRRRVVVDDRDPKSGKLLSKKVVEQEVVAPVGGGKPTVRTLSCTVDGKAADVSACKPKRKPRPPLYQVLGAEGQKHYTLRYRKKTRVQGVEGYELAVIPKAKTERHMSGRAVVAADDYRLLLVEGRPASLPFGVKSLYVKILFAKRGKLATVSLSGYFDIWVRVPLVANKHITSTFTDSGHLLLPR